MYNSCSNLPLRIFCEILHTGNVSLLNTDNAAEVWEKIFMEFCALDNNFAYKGLIFKQAQIRNFETQHFHVSTIILFLLNYHRIYARIKKEHVDYLIKKGYKIDLKTHSGYIESLAKAMNRSKHLQARVQSLKNELENESKQSEGKNTGFDFDELMAWMLEYGFQVSEDVTVKRFLSIKKRISERIKRTRSNNGRGLQGTRKAGR